MEAPHILIVEDELSIAENIIYALETENFTTTHHAVGANVIEAVQTTRFDLIVLDIGLPDILGFDLCRKIRGISNVPILFLTARDSEVDQVLGLELGADDFVSKPFSPRSLAARIRAILRRGQTSSNSAAISQILSHNPDAMQIHCLGKKLDLTAHEYKLLATFMGQPGRTFTRDQLLDKVWDDPGSIMDRTVDAHIKSLRAKLRLASPLCEDLIQTHRGLGYSYNAPAHA